MVTKRPMASLQLTEKGPAVAATTIAALPLHRTAAGALVAPKVAPTHTSNGESRD